MMPLSTTLVLGVFEISFLSYLKVRVSSSSANSCRYKNRFLSPFYRGRKRAGEVNTLACGHTARTW